MATEDQDDNLWPPAPDAGYQAPRPPSPQRLAAWVRALFAAVLGAAVGAGTLLAALFAAFFIMNDGGGPIFFVLAVAAAGLVGGFVGTVVGLVIWFVRDARARASKRSG